MRLECLAASRGRTCLPSSSQKSSEPQSWTSFSKYHWHSSLHVDTSMLPLSFTKERLGYTFCPESKQCWFVPTVIVLRRHMCQGRRFKSCWPMIDLSNAWRTTFLKGYFFLTEELMEYENTLSCPFHVPAIGRGKSRKSLRRRPKQRLLFFAV